MRQTSLCLCYARAVFRFHLLQRKRKHKRNHKKKEILLLVLVLALVLIPSSRPFSRWNKILFMFVLALVLVLVLASFSENQAYILSLCCYQWKQVVSPRVVSPHLKVVSIYVLLLTSNNAQLFNRITGLYKKAIICHHAINISWVKTPQLFVFLLTKYNIIFSPGFHGQRFNDLQRAAHLASYGRHWLNHVQRAAR